MHGTVRGNIEYEVYQCDQNIIIGKILFKKFVLDRAHADELTHLRNMHSAKFICVLHVPVYLNMSLLIFEYTGVMF